MDSVSIPHRYGKNCTRRTNSILNTDVSIPHRYGKNGLALQWLEENQMFPFLIGTVRTVITLGLYLTQLLVSIPHRYGKNLF